MPTEKSKTLLSEEPLERVKKVEITNVEENAKNLEEENKGKKMFIESQLNNFYL